MAKQVTTEGDGSFFGMNTRVDAANLPESVLSYAQNIRLTTGIASARKGLSRLSSSSLNDINGIIGSGNYTRNDGRAGVILVYTSYIYVYYPAQGSYAEEVTGPINYPATYAATSHPVDVVQVGDEVYFFRGAITATSTPAGGTAGDVYKAAATNLVTFKTGVRAHGLSVGDGIIVYNNSINPLPHTSLIGSWKVESVTDAYTFTYRCEDFGGALTHPTGNVVEAYTPLYWNGSSSVLENVPFTEFFGANASMPCGDFGLVFQNRMVVAAARPQIINGLEQWVTDCLCVSDILDYRTYDQQLNAFIMSDGGSDSLVGAIPWVNNSLLVFMQNSVKIAYIEPSYTIGSAVGANSSLEVISSEIGCVSRRTIVPAGQNIFFISSKGVHVLTPQLDVKLIGNTLPLSDQISDIFDKVDMSRGAEMCGLYVDNRIYFSVPIYFGQEGYAGYSVNVLVYNTINKQWESVDTFPDTVLIQSLIACNFKSTTGVVTRKRPMMLVYSVAGGGGAVEGGLFVMEENEEGDEVLVASSSPILPFRLPSTISNTYSIQQVDAYMLTREYMLGTDDEKLFTKISLGLDTYAGDYIAIDCIASAPNAEERVMDYESDTDGSVQLRTRVALRGTSVQARVSFIAGRPSLNSLYFHGTVDSVSKLSQ